MVYRLGSFSTPWVLVMSGPLPAELCGRAQNKVASVVVGLVWESDAPDSEEFTLLTF